MVCRAEVAGRSNLLMRLPKKALSAMVFRFGGRVMLFWILPYMKASVPILDKESAPLMSS